jgi:hypothetical protein
MLEPITPVPIHPTRVLPGSALRKVIDWILCDKDATSGQTGTAWELEMEYHQETQEGCLAQHPPSTPIAQGSGTCHARTPQTNPIGAQGVRVFP